MTGGMAVADLRAAFVTSVPTVVERGGRMHWKVQVAIDGVKSFVPFENTLRHWKRRFFPYSDPVNDPGLFAHGIKQIQMLRDVRIEIEGANVLEFGSGWRPIIPLLFRIAGARSVTLTDQDHLMDDNLIENAILYIRNRADQVRRDLGVSESQILDKLTCGDEDKMQALGFRYLVPFDPATVPTASMDIIISRAVLEHVPEDGLRAFMREFKRILKPGGMACHIIDLSDHWEHKDKSISRVNFLKYPDWQWRLTCLHPQNYQNRLRRVEYRQILLDAGFTIITQSAETHAASLEALDTLPLADRFRAFGKDELAIITASFVARA
jgi:SAM-dependent methyltransferase